MKIYCLNTCSILSLFQFVLFSHLFLSHFKLSLALDDTLHGLGCKLLYCGQGKCTESDATIFGADCECYSGWKKIQFGPFTFPSCLIPNCTVDFQCGGGSPAPASPPPPPPPPQSFFPTINFSNPCNFVWCGDGSCKANGTNYTCDCNAGSGNLFNSSTLACFKPCYLGTDCSGLDIVVQGTSSPPAPTPPSPNSSGSHRHDSKGGLVSPAASANSSDSVNGYGLGSLYGGAILLQTLIIAWW